MGSYSCRCGFKIHELRMPWGFHYISLIILAGFLWTSFSVKLLEMQTPSPKMKKNSKWMLWFCLDPRLKLSSSRESFWKTTFLCVFCSLLKSLMPKWDKASIVFEDSVDDSKERNDDLKKMIFMLWCSLSIFKFTSLQHIEWYTYLSWSDRTLIRCFISIIYEIYYFF